MLLLFVLEFGGFTVKKLIFALFIVIFLGACNGTQNSPVDDSSNASADSVPGDSTGPLFKVEVDDRYGFINRKGEMVIEPKFERVGEFSEGLASFGERMPMGFINKKGEIVIRANENMYLSSDRFSEGLVPFACYPGERGPFKHKVGYIDRKGKIVIKAQFEDARSFSEGLAPVKIGKKWGYIDKTGKVVIQPAYKDYGHFINGIAIVLIQRGERAYIDKSGKFILKVKSSYAGRFIDGVAFVKRGDKYVCIDKTGKKVFPQEFERAYRFSDGLALVKLNGKWGWINRKGEFVIKPQFDNAAGFAEGLSVVQVKRRWGYIDKTGKFAIEPMFEDADNFRHGLAWVRLDQGDTYLTGYIDKTGEFVWNSSPKESGCRETGGPPDKEGGSPGK
jgi:predicted DNA-binding WGR domain protein